MRFFCRKELNSGNDGQSNITVKSNDNCEDSHGLKRDKFIELVVPTSTQVF